MLSANNALELKSLPTSKEDRHTEISVDCWLRAGSETEDKETATKGKKETGEATEKDLLTESQRRETTIRIRAFK
jgi:hypothetical protein